MAAGIALGLKIQNIPAKVFVLIGDGECNEGSIWETAMIAAHQKLNNLCVIVDYNHSTDRALQLGDIVSKFKAFGWDSGSINGHDLGQIQTALHSAATTRPCAVIAETIKGHGCAPMENNPAWHHRAPTEDEMESFLRSLT
jgi:transketolase